MLKIGVGAGFSGDRLEPAETLLKKVDLDYIVYECLAERTIALAQQRKLKNNNHGYDPLLEKRIERILPLLHEKDVRLITNMGAANPVAAGNKIIEIAKKQNIPCKVAVVTGDHAVDQLNKTDKIIETNKQLNDYEPIISANAYLGVEALLPALKSKANIIITGRVADPSLFLAPQVYHFGWELNDYEKLGQGTVIGHLLECSGQVSGGYFADQRKKQVTNLHDLGFPYAMIKNNGDAIISKAEGTGGLINLNTVKEQLLYEVHDPTSYITPDVKADFTTVKLEEINDNEVKVTGGTGEKKPEQLKVSVGYHAGYIGLGEISYAGYDALERAEIARDILQKRLSDKIEHLRIDFIGASSTHRKAFIERKPYEVRVRASGNHEVKSYADLIGHEVESLYLNGPAAGGGVYKRTTQSIGIVSTFISRHHIKPETKILSFR